MKINYFLLGLIKWLRPYDQTQSNQIPTNRVELILIGTIDSMWKTKPP